MTRVCELRLARPSRGRCEVRGGQAIMIPRFMCRLIGTVVFQLLFAWASSFVCLDLDMEGSQIMSSRKGSFDVIR
jgi:hypothetical protein